MSRFHFIQKEEGNSIYSLVNYVEENIYACGGCDVRVILFNSFVPGGHTFYGT